MRRLASAREHLAGLGSAAFFVVTLRHDRIQRPAVSFRNLLPDGVEQREMAAIDRVVDGLCDELGVVLGHGLVVVREDLVDPGEGDFARVQQDPRGRGHFAVNHHRLAAEVANFRERVRVIAVARNQDHATRDLARPMLPGELHDVDDQFFVQRLFLAARRTVDQVPPRRVQVDSIGVLLGRLPRVVVQVLLHDVAVREERVPDLRAHARGLEIPGNPHVLEVPEHAHIHGGELPRLAVSRLVRRRGGRRRVVAAPSHRSSRAASRPEALCGTHLAFEEVNTRGDTRLCL
mmetsp:Transcript_11091/g.35233  ORF Transcript_11091/g.35233 Transcript_11091/m.35233 type:complete len:290 (+) Transcript_11091:986-1855(+)